MNNLIIVSVLLLSASSVLGEKHHDKKDRIIGGNNVPIQHYPYMVSLQYNGSFYCAGAIISLDRILTSALCVNGTDKSMLSVRVGSSSFRTGGEVIKVAEVRVHPQFAFIGNDVAILVLEKSVTEGPNIKRAPIQASGKEVEDDSDAVIAGWGYTSRYPSILPPVSQQLKAATVHIVNQQKCKAAYEGQYDIPDCMICAAAPGKDACRGDTGGPMVDLDNNIVGIISWNVDCANPKYPSVYTKVSFPGINQFIVANLQ